MSMYPPEGNDPSAPLHDPWGLSRARVLSFISQKGGVGKTTSAVNLAACFALSGHRVLLVGTDPQCGVSRSFGYTPDRLRGGLRDVILSGLSLDEVAHPTELDGLRIVVPDVWTLPEEQQYRKLMEERPDALAAAVHASSPEYDTILIDCPPGFGVETQASLRASDAYLVPVQAEELCRASLDRLLRFVDEFAAHHCPRLQREGLFLTMTDHRTRMSRRVADLLDDEFGPDLLDTSVPRNTRLTEMAQHGKPTVIHDRRSQGSRAYFDLMDEIVLRFLKADRSQATQAQEPDLPVEPREEIPEPASLQAATAAAGSHRLLRELFAATRRVAAPAAGDGSSSLLDLEPEASPDEPDFISLDELVAEEERGERDDRYDFWGYGDDDYDTVN